MSVRGNALVIGARGVIGGNLVEHLSGTDNWDVVGISRRGAENRPRIRHERADLLDLDSTRAAIGRAAETTHLFYAAYQDRPNWSDLVEPNVTMLRNVLDSVDLLPALEHVSLMQGYKVYGAHLGPFATPAKESDPPHMPPEFNVDQQQLLERRQRGQSWSWSAIRPSVVAGVTVGNPMNIAMVLAVYASISKELGIPLRFPGKPGAYTSLIEMTDAGLLARATEWAATTPSAANEAFNITNGDMFRWQRMWSVVADFFDIPVADPLPMSLSEVMADKQQVWDAMVAEYGLEPTPYEDVSSWQFGDFVFGWDYDVIADTSKSRRAGFHDYIETDAMFTRIFQQLRERRLIP
ncbi:SDR family oxidoreductase [Gordonia polyisoprenivorans]|uniref:SDR family oxidoreductase n=1 Tax=Gordonia polyisoprenivorans TaxID=84595 RepID=UPI0023010989|nr:SDR family oxidoreductase [Gordonia polyisoprenivorans]WCB37477.1 SDR family oxidoreductase [Gordonia polyisoprenivorans]